MHTRSLPSTNSFRPQTRSQTNAQHRRSFSVPQPLVDDPKPPCRRRKLEPLPQQHQSPTPAALFEHPNPNSLAKSSSKRKRETSPTAAFEQRVKKERLTKSNLRALQRSITATNGLPEALNEWKDILLRSSTAPSEHIGQMAKNKMPKKSGKSKTKTTAKSTTGTGLSRNPFGYAMSMGERYGVLQPEINPMVSDDQLQLGLAVARFPNNYLEIRKALEKDRVDLPSMDAFVKFCQNATEIALAPDEGEMAALFNLFIDPQAWNGFEHRHGRHTLVVPPGLLPPPQKLVKPDMAMGIVPAKLRKRHWIAKHLPGYIRNRLLICANGLVEYKSGEGNMAAARIQNQAAAKLLCEAWLEDERMLASMCAFTSEDQTANPGGPSDGTVPNDATMSTTQVEDADQPQEKTTRADHAVIGKAFVGSICFDGNAIEASVHWLDHSITSNERKYDVFSLRVATGHPFATTLSEYQATYKRFANLFDWLLDARSARLKQILAQTESEPRAIARPEPDYESSKSEDGGEESDGDGESPAEQSSTASQPIGHMSLQSSARPTDDAGAAPGQGKGKRKNRSVANAVSSVAKAAAKRLKQKKT